MYLKCEGIIEEISYEPSAYESVDNRSTSKVILHKSTENITKEPKGYNYVEFVVPLA